MNTARLIWSTCLLWSAAVLHRSSLRCRPRLFMCSTHVGRHRSSLYTMSIGRHGLEEVRVDVFDAGLTPFVKGDSSRAKGGGQRKTGRSRSRGKSPPLPPAPLEGDAGRREETQRDLCGREGPRIHRCIPGLSVCCAASLPPPSPRTGAWTSRRACSLESGSVSVEAVRTLSLCVRTTGQESHFPVCQPLIGGPHFGSAHSR